MEIGQPIRVVEAPAPVDIPLPVEEPAPIKEPVKAPKEKEKEPVPA